MSLIFMIFSETNCKSELMQDFWEKAALSSLFGNYQFSLGKLWLDMQKIWYFATLAALSGLFGNCQRTFAPFVWDGLKLWYDLENCRNFDAIPTPSEPCDPCVRPAPSLLLTSQIQIHKYTNTQIHKCTNTQTHTQIHKSRAGQVRLEAVHSCKDSWLAKNCRPVGTDMSTSSSSPPSRPRYWLIAKIKITPQHPSP